VFTLHDLESEDISRILDRSNHDAVTIHNKTESNDDVRLIAGFNDVQRVLASTDGFNCLGEVLPPHQTYEFSCTADERPVGKLDNVAVATTVDALSDDMRELTVEIDTLIANACTDESIDAQLVLDGCNSKLCHAPIDDEFEEAVLAANLSQLLTAVIADDVRNQNSELAKSELDSCSYVSAAEGIDITYNQLLCAEGDSERTECKQSERMTILQNCAENTTGIKEKSLSAIVQDDRQMN
jgi:hypothetical protein